MKWWNVPISTVKQVALGKSFCLNVNLKSECTSYYSCHVVISCFCIIFWGAKKYVSAQLVRMHITVTLWLCLHFQMPVYFFVVCFIDMLWGSRPSPLELTCWTNKGNRDENDFLTFFLLNKTNKTSSVIWMCVNVYVQNYHFTRYLRIVTA